MTRFVVKGTIELEVTVEIDADNEDAARETYSQHVSASASIDHDVKDKVTMIEDSIEDLDIIDVDQAAEAEDPKEDDGEDADEDDKDGEDDDKDK